MLERLILEVLFADDCAPMTHKESDLQLIVNKSDEVTCLFGLTISLGKTEVLFQPDPRSAALPAFISIEGAELKPVDEFKHFGSVIASDGSLDKETNNSICKANQVVGHLRARVSNQHNVRQSTKLKVYKAVVLTNLLYECKTWTLYRKHVKLLERFRTLSLRSILYTEWQDRVMNLEVLDRAGTTSTEATILKAQLCWAEHVIRMEESRVPKQLLYGELFQGKRNQGGPCKRYKDCVKTNIAPAGLKPKQLEQHAEDQTGWRALV
ncbi:uncharacterized protein LOC142010469 [Carettochelys insculpta]|uniref:uncharacterized protein LOC142010469 n=1 Tax=Carettochelys insculpta TaxID=44489 RepID=UPI003EB96F64